jgi:1-acyl-sn-glycerol-3-phosphate acyltransferase
MPVNPYSKLEAKDFTWFREFFQAVVVFTLTLKLHWKYSFRVEGRENIPPRSEGSFIIAANHTSDLDPPIVSVAFRFRPIAYMAKDELFSTPFKAWFYHQMCTFAVNRKKVEISSIRSAQNVIKAGRYLLGIFPQGTRMQSVQEIKKGTTFIAKSAKASILPVGIVRKGPEGKEIIVRIGTMIPFNSDLEAMAQQLQQALISLTADAPQPDPEEAEPSRLSEGQ